MKSPILGGSTTVESLNAAVNSCTNLYPEITQDGKEPAYLKRCPGLTVACTVGNGPIRGLHVAANGLLYVASGNSLYSVTTAFSATLLGAITVSNAQVVMTSSATEVFVACGQRGYIVDLSGGTLTEIADVDFSGAQTAGYLDGYFVFNPPDEQTVWVTELLDGSDISALDFASAETEADELIAVVISHREAWLFGETTTEVWYNQSAGSGFPLARIQGASLEVGIASPHAWARLDNTIVWLANDGIVYRAEGYLPRRISTHTVEQWITDNADLEDAVAYSYRHNGHQFFVLSFTGADNTWVFDTATGLWHERRGWENGEWTRHRSNCYASFNGQHIVGDFDGGQLYIMTEDARVDGANVQRAMRRWRALPPGTGNLKRQTHHSLTLDIEAGVGLDGVSTTQGHDPQVMLRWSNDAGHTWSNELWRSIGKIGEKFKRVIWRRLGDTDALRDRIYEIVITDPVKIAIMGAELDVEAKDA